jgi:Cu/Ag efflux pump CusA
MMRWIVESSLKYRLVVVAVAVAIMAAGARQISEMSVDVLPEFTPTTVEIQTGPSRFPDSRGSSSSLSPGPTSCAHGRWCKNA